MTTQQEVLALFTYNESTGEFRHKTKASANVEIGDIAGYKGKTYIILRIKGKNYLAHRVAYLYKEGKIPKFVDHKDTNGYNNAWDNLRAATQAENIRNASTRSDNFLGIKGLCYVDRRSPYYKASIRDKNKKDHTKNFSISRYGSHDNCKVEAVKWLTEKRNLFHEEFANHG